MTTMMNYGVVGKILTVTVIIEMERERFQHLELKAPVLALPPLRALGRIS